MIFSKAEYVVMALALKLAQKAKYHTQPNPMVGCVITDADNQVLASGYHQHYGGNHAEVEALNVLEQLNHSPIRQRLKLFVTLEPCCFVGKTPPCTEIILKSGIKKVVIAMLDPNPKVSGRGVKILKKSDVDVKIGLLETEAKQLNYAFVKAMKIQRPFVRCKIAMSLDGKTAMKNGQSHWISNQHARDDVQMLRMEADAILTGSGTVLSDNPHLNVRQKNCTRPPVRIVLDTNNRIALSAYIFSNEAPTLHCTRNNTQVLDNKIALKPLLKKLHQQGINHILLEAGSTLVGTMLAAGLIDEFIIYTAPLIMGSGTKNMVDLAIKSLENAIRLEIKSVRMIGNNLKITAVPEKIWQMNTPKN